MDFPYKDYLQTKTTCKQRLSANKDYLQTKTSALKAEYFRIYTSTVSSTQWAVRNGQWTVDSRENNGQYAMNNSTDVKKLHIPIPCSSKSTCPVPFCIWINVYSPRPLNV